MKITVEIDGTEFAFEYGDDWDMIYKGDDEDFNRTNRHIEESEDYDTLEIVCEELHVDLEVVRKRLAKCASKEHLKSIL